MNAEDFYEEFKEAIKYLGPGWTGKEYIQVSANQDCIVLSYENLKVEINLVKGRKIYRGTVKNETSI